MLHELVELLLIEPQLLDLFGFLIGFAHVFVGLVDCGFALLDGSDLLINSS